MVRREDVRGYEKDKVVMAEGFRVGDLVRGIVVCCILIRRSSLFKANNVNGEN